MNQEQKDILQRIYMISCNIEAAKTTLLQMQLMLPEAIKDAKEADIPDVLIKLHSEVFFDGEKYIKRNPHYRPVLTQ